MKRTLIGLALLALASTAHAQVAVGANVEAGAGNTDAPQAQAAPPATQQDGPGRTAKDDMADRNCMKYTGSRIAPRADAKGRKCNPASGRAYDRHDIERTGATDLRDALRRLDPAVH